MLLLLLLFFVSCSLGYLTPQCRKLCDDPICNAICEPVCNVTCDYQCMGNLRICQPPVCQQRCSNQDQSVADSCPVCETTCQPLVCSNPEEIDCNILCEPIECQWACRKPLDSECPPMTCEWQCERPACEYPHDYFASSASLTTPLLLFLLLAVVVAMV